MDVGSRVGSPRNTGADGVADAIDEGSLFLCQLDGSQRVGRLTALRDGNHYILLCHHWVTVAELRGILHLARDTAQALEELLADETRMP